MERVTGDLGADAALDLGKLLAARRVAVTACPYLASALFAMAIVPSRSVPTMAVDRYWRCYVSPAFVAATELHQLAAVWLHEAAHLIRGHHDRARLLKERSARHTGTGTPALDPDNPAGEQLRLNIAMDLEINDDLLAGVPMVGGRLLRLPDGAVTPTGMRLPRRDLFEEYVRDLPPMALRGELVWTDCGSGSHDGHAPWELDGTGAHPLSEHEAAAIRIRVRDALALGRGTVPAGWKRWADGLAEPSQDWRTLLGAAFRGTLAAGSGAGDYTYRRPGRRTPALGGRVVLPGLRRPLPQVAVVVDTSGSVTDADLGSALSEIAGISRAVGLHGSRVSVYSCDAAVQTVQQICRVEEISLVGGGGTDLRQGIRRAVDGTPRPEVVVVLTDGGTPWPDAAPGCRVIAGIFGSRPRYSEEESRPGWFAPDWAETVALR